MLKHARAACAAALLLTVACETLPNAEGLLGVSVPFGTRALTQADIAAGLREALRVGTARVVTRVSRVDGFNGDPNIHIPLPARLARVQTALRRVGAAGLADDLELRLNRAAEAATPQAKAIFWRAVADMTLEDIHGIYRGPDDAATQYFRGKMTPQLLDALRPVVDRQLAAAGAVRAYDRMMGRYRAIPLVRDVKADLTEYGLQRTLDGMFVYLAREEAAIRRDPAKRTTALLRRVFGARG